MSERTGERCFLTKGQEDEAFKGLKKTDPEFIELFDNFAFHEVIHMPEIGGKKVGDRTRRQWRGKKWCGKIWNVYGSYSIF